MSFESVDVYVKDSTPAEDPIEGVLVRVFNQAGSTFFTQSTTDSDGHVGFTLETLTYSIRLYKLHVGFQQPQTLQVLASPAVNTFDVSGEVFVLPIATDPRLCKCSGYFRDVSGAPKAFLDIHFIACFDPILLDGDGIVTERQAIRTDENGYASIDLIRNAQYNVFLQEFEDQPREIVVPDRSSVNLPDLIYAVVDEVVLDPVAPYAMLVGEQLTVTPTVLTSSYVELTGTAMRDVSWSSSDEAVLSVQPDSDVLTLTARSAGTAQVQAERRDQTIIRIPNTPIVGLPADVTVS
jgi:hypothetical protein